MKKIMLVGRSESGKTTLTQALRGQKMTDHKTQYIEFKDLIIDTPGEYAENKDLASALALYSYEADVIGLLVSAIEPYTLFPPNIVTMVNREVIGIVTKIDEPQANLEQKKLWLELSGCQEIFFVSATTGKGLEELTNHLKKV